MYLFYNLETIENIKKNNKEKFSYVWDGDPGSQLSLIWVNLLTVCCRKVSTQQVLRKGTKKDSLE